MSSKLACNNQKERQMTLKRSFDFIISLVLLLFCFAPMVLIAFFIFAKLGRPVLFMQERPGLNEKKFKLYKFRSMREIVDKEGQILRDEERLTQFGKFLRSTSLDELPELINILKGDMSFVGPRPLLPEYLPYYNAEQKKRHSVRPGLTGWAQINGRNATSWEQRFQYDCEYVQRQSLLFDLQILLKTFLIVFKREGVTHQGHVTMPRFDDYTRAQNAKQKGD